MGVDGRVATAHADEDAAAVALVVDLTVDVQRSKSRTNDVDLRRTPSYYQFVCLYYVPGRSWKTLPIVPFILWTADC